MLSLHPAPASPLWIDLQEPTADELSRAEALFGAPLPSLDALSEIETSSRLRRRGETLYMSMPSAVHRQSDGPVTPVGFVLSAKRLVTLRFAQLPAFEAVAARFGDEEKAPESSVEVFTAICEEIVDKVADGLEHLAEQVGGLSQAAFHADDTRGRHSVRSNRVLRIQLRQLGRAGDRLSEYRDGLAGLGRIVAFADQFTTAWCAAPLKDRLASLRQDIRSLGEYEEQLANKVQFVLDAMIGLIGIAQNDVFKVLTIVSIVGIPPTLMAGVYGMNFKNMPEYDWAFGYQWGWAMIILSALIPLIWFKVKGWF